MTHKNTAVFGLLSSRSAAEHAVLELEAAGFPSSDISVLLSENGADRDLALEHHTKAPEGALAGGSLGGALGGAFGALVGVGAVAAPALGVLVAAGPIMAALSVAAVGAVFGSIAGGLVGLGVPEIQARAYEGKVRGGSALVAVHTEDEHELDRVKSLLKRHDAIDVSSIGEKRVSKAS